MNTKHSSIVKKAADIALGNFGKGVDKVECESFEYYQKSADMLLEWNKLDIVIREI